LLPLVIIWHRRERAPLLPIVAVEQPA
jgi:hypothetical protein